MKRCCDKPGRALLGLVLCLGAGQTATAASLALVPVRLALSASHPIGAITVRNDGTDATVVQIEAASWSQVDGLDVYTASAEILATPPIFTVPPGGSQLVRVGLRRAADANHELTYRVFLQEVPPPATAEFRGLHVALRFGVPVFVAAAKAQVKGAVAPVAALQWHARAATASGQITLIATNAGAAHVQVTHFTLAPSGDPAGAVSDGSPEYVLPGQHKEWQIELKPVPAAGTSLHVSAGTDAGPLEADVVVGTPE
jgi:fimbrial chaperone protein